MSHAEGDDPTLDLRGWSSSFTGKAIPAEDMRAWVEATVARILELQPRNVLEIGCGTGLLLCRIAPKVQRYHGCDLSAEAIAHIERLKAQLPSLAGVSAIQAPAHAALQGAPCYDTVVLNSVAQYFPSAAYLEEVLSGALDHLQGPGALFIGDVRNHALFRMYHCAVAAASSPEELGREELRRQSERAMVQDNELLIHPSFFQAFAAASERISAVEIHLKPGAYRNELSMFRYDVVLRVEGPRPLAPAVPWRDWQAEQLTLSTLRDRIVATLASAEPLELAFTQVPNERLSLAAALEHWAFAADADDGTPAAAIAPIDSGVASAVDPEALYQLAAELGVSVRLSWARGDASGAFDLWIGRAAAASVLMPAAADAALEISNNPLQAARQKQLVAHIRSQLKQLLPAPMIPSSITVLSELPLTINGKVDLAQLPPPAADSAPTPDDRAPESDTELALAEIWRELLGLDRVGLADNFFELGGDSIIAVQVVARARARGLTLRASQIFEQQTLAELAAVAIAHAAPTQDEQELIGAVPLSPIQRWFFEHPRPHPEHFNQAVLLVVPGDVDAAALAVALRAVVRHHAALRHRFVATADGWTQRCLADAEVQEGCPLACFDLTDRDGPAAVAAIEQHGSELQACFDLERGPVTRAALFRLPQGGRLLWAVHHLVVDALSWRVLLEDLETAYGQAARGEIPQLPAKTTAWGQWCSLLANRAQTLDVSVERKQLQRPAPPPLPVDHPEASNDRATAAIQRVALAEESTRALFGEGLRAYRLRPQELLLTALARALRAWSGASALWLDLEGHGREELFADAGLDLSRTVGWFTALFPVHLELPPAADLGVELLAIKEQLRAIPRRGVGFGLLRHLHPDGVGLPWPACQISFNFLGRAPAGLNGPLIRGFAIEPCGPSEAMTGPRTHLLSINAGERDGRLEIAIEFSAALHEPASVRALAEAMLAEIELLLAHALQPGAGALSASDAPLVPLEAPALAAIARQLGGASAIEAILPLTGLQRGLLARVLYDDQQEAYATHIALTLHGDLDATLLRRAWDQLVERHELLRSCFLWEGLPLPVQVICRQAQMPWQELDQRGDDAAAVTDDRVIVLPVALNRPPVGRVTLARQAERRHTFIFHSHHLLLDGWSMFVLVRDMLELYRSLATAQPARLPVPGSYETYANRVAAQDLDRDRAFWRLDLAGFDEPTPLPAERDQVVGATEFRRETLRLEAELTARLLAVAERERITLATLIEGLWALVMARHADRDEVLFGGVVSGRDLELPGIEQMAGLFIHTLPVRLRIEEEEEVWSWLRAHQSRQAERRDHQHLPLGEIQQQADLAPGLELFRCLVAVENYPIDAGIFAAAGLRVEFHSASSPTHYPLVVSALPGERLEIHLDYDSARLAPAAIGRLGGQLEQLARQLLTATPATAAARLESLTLTTTAERQQLLRWAHGGEACVTPAPTIHDLFERRVDRDPDALAVIVPALAGGHRAEIRYGELEDRANRVANALLAKGVTPGAIVGLLLPRGIEVVVAILAVLKAGAAFVVLDAELPAERLAAMLADAQPAALVVEPQLLDPALAAGVPRLPLAEALATGSNQRPAPVLAPDALAYLLYTSGTTGTPNGVLVEHRGISNVLIYAAQLLELDAASRFANSLSLNFDGGLCNLLTPLCAGATAVLVPRAGDYLGAGLLNVLVTEGVSHLLLVPSMLAALPEAELPALRALMVAGERCPAELVQRWGPGRRFWNLYGPTELSVWATYAACQPDGRVPCIGRPIPGISAHVVDRRGRLAPFGASGELWLAGVGVARGYLNRPELNARKFLDNPFGEGRLYRSGDLVRWRLEEGSTQPVLDFLGRSDQQVKIGGQRLELGEIEAQLRTCAGVRDAVVISHGEGRGQRLVAYVVPTAAAAIPTERELRAALRRKLPDALLPASFIPLETLPLTVNGKVDRRALPEPAATTPVDRSEPRSEIEQVLIEIWQRTLQREQISIHDNYFELGGDSISSIQIVSQLQALGYTLKASQLFDHQTVASLAEVVGSTANAAAQGLVVGPVPLTPIQRWFLDLDLPHRSHFNQAVLLEAPADLVLDHLQAALLAVVSHHDLLRTRLTSHQDQWNQSISALCEAPSIELHPLEELDRSAQSAAIHSVMARLQASLDISAGPLLRMALFQLGAQQPARLFWVIHHLAVDAVSWTVLIADLAMAYQQAAAAEPIRLPAKTTSFQRWAERLRELAASDAFAAERASLAELAPTPLPLDHHGHPNRLETAAEHRVRLGVEATRMLLTQALRPYNLGVQELLLAALAEALAPWTGLPEIWIEMEGHGRESLLDEDLDVSRTVGWFTSLFPLRLPLAADSASERLIAVKEAVRTVPRRGIGYGLLRHLHPDGPSLAWPRAEISFNYLGQVQQQTDAVLGLRRASEGVGPCSASSGERPHLLAINARLVDDELAINLGYSRAHHDTATIEGLASGILQALQGLIQHCATAGARALTPSDFPLVELSRAELAAVLSQVDARADDVEAILPLIAVQPELLASSVEAGAAAMWRTQVVLEIDGGLDAGLLQQAWRWLLQQQPLLRSCFAWQGLRQPVQVVRRDPALPWQELDWSARQDGEDALGQLCQDLIARELPLHRAPLLRLVLARWSNHRHALVVDAHHLLADGWSLGVMLRNLATAYGDLQADRQPRPVTPGVYERYLRWRSTVDLEPDRHYWMEGLRGFRQATPLPMEHSDDPGDGLSSSHAHFNLNLEAKATARLYTAAETAKVTAATLLDAAWATLLQRHSGRSDVVFGMTVSGRDVPVPGVEAVVGHFIDFLPLRIHCRAEADWRSWLQGVQQTRSDAIRHQLLSLSEIQRCSELPEDQPLFRSFVVFENYPLELALFEHTGLDVKLRSGASHASDYPLAVGAMPKQDQLTLFFNYDTAHFEADAVANLAAELATILMDISEACEAVQYEKPEQQSSTAPSNASFPVVWDSPQDAEEMWLYDQIHCPTPISRLDYQLRLLPFILGTNRSNKRFGLPIASEPKLINGYVYNRIVNDEIDPAQLSQILQDCDEKVRRGYADLNQTWRQLWLPQIQEQLAVLTSIDITAASLVELCSHLRVVRTSVEALWELHNDLLMPVLMAMHDFEEAFRDLFPDAGPLEVFDLLGGLPNKTTETNLALWTLGRQASQHAALRTLLTEAEPTHVLEQLPLVEGGQAFLIELEAFLQTYGERNDSLLLDQPSWLEDPSAMIRGLREAVLQPDRDLVAAFERSADNREQKIAATRARLSSLPTAVVDEFERLLTTAQVATILSEDHHFWIDCKITYQARRVAVEIGRRLVELELIDSPDDVFQLGIEDLGAIPDSKQQRDSLRYLVLKRKTELARFASLQPPLLLGVPRQLLPLDSDLIKVGTKFSGSLSQTPVAAGASLHGMPASSGKVSGPARIVHSLEEIDKLCPGEILVTDFTLPSWTPFFASIAGLVTNVGGMLCHAAVVAREYRVPAVVGTGQATDIFHDGQLIEVDGDAGTVRLLHEPLA
ncbi:MAG: amino acid adenylation domain-containing protein [Cyanobium sp.]